MRLRADYRVFLFFGVSLLNGEEGLPVDYIKAVSYTHLDVYKRQL